MIINTNRLKQLCKLKAEVIKNISKEKNKDKRLPMWDKVRVLNTQIDTCLKGRDLKSKIPRTSGL